jgi:hypothetical protein
MKFTLTKEQQLEFGHYMCCCDDTFPTPYRDCDDCPLYHCIGTDNKNRGSSCSWASISLCDETVINAMKKAKKNYPEFAGIYSKLPFLVQLLHVKIK